MDHIEWDLLSPLTPEMFAQQLCADLGLSGEALPLIAHAIHEEILRHKKDAIEWGIIGGDKEVPDEPTIEKPRDKSGLSLMKDKTGLGLGGWGRTPKDGRGPKPLKSVWKDWQEANDYATRYEILTTEEVERREIERERASRYGSFYPYYSYVALKLTTAPGGCAEKLPNFSFRLRLVRGDGDCWHLRLLVRWHSTFSHVTVQK